MSSDDSSSDDESSERLKEAVWAWGSSETPHDRKRNVKVSKRVDVSEHQHDGNELQTTPEFRSHVARKLVAMLDSYITVASGVPDTTPDQCENGQEGADDAGFRLFSTSLPGRRWEEPSTPLLPERPPAPSSSDTDSEMELRLREAAVCVSDLLPPPTEQPQEKAESEDSTTEGPVPVIAMKKKRRKRKKASPRERDEEECLSKADGAVLQEQCPEDRVLKRMKKIRSDEGQRN